MKTLPTALATHYASGTTTLADLLKITRKDGQIFAFTSASTDVTISGQLYTSAQGLDISSLEVTAGLAVDNLELTTLDDGTIFSRLEVLAGVWRNADFTISRYNWASPSDGIEVRMVGTVGEVHLKRGSITAELRGLQQYLQQPIGSVTSKTCRARLGDGMCGVDLAGYTVNGVVTDTDGNQVLFDTTITVPGDDYLSSVSTLLFFDGVADSTVFADSSPSPQACTVSGAAILKSTQSRSGGTSLYIPSIGANSGNAATTDATHNFGTGDFTVEFMFYTAAVSTNTKIFAISQLGALANIGGAMLALNAHTGTRVLELQAVRNSSSYAVSIATASASFNNNAWNHIAIVRASGAVYLYVNGVMRATAAWPDPVNYNTNMKVMVGGWQTTSLPSSYYEDVRVTKGYARYVAPFSADVYADRWPVVQATRRFSGFSADYFAEGILTFTSGPLFGLAHKVKSSSEGALGSFILSLPAIQSPSVGDAFTVVAGCQKRLSDCSGKFNNVLNFQGEPHLPGIDAVTA